MSPKTGRLQNLKKLNKGATIEMKALNKCILMVLFVLVVKREQDLSVTTQNALREYILMALFMLLLKRVHFLVIQIEDLSS